MAAVSIDAALYNARSVLRGEVTGSVRLLVLAAAALGTWVAVSLAGGWIGEAEQALVSQEKRYRTLSILAGEYGALAPTARAPQTDVDVPAVFAQVSERMGLGNRVNRITPDGRNQSIEVNRLYAEEFVELERQLASRGVHFLSAELRALPSGQERLFSVTAIIGPGDGGRQ